MQKQALIFLQVFSVTAMAPMKKYTAPSGFIYEKNNFASFVDTKAVEEKEYHKMMEFIKSSQLSYAMTEALPSIMK